MPTSCAGWACCCLKPQWRRPSLLSWAETEFLWENTRKSTEEQKKKTCLTACSTGQKQLLQNEGERGPCPPSVGRVPDGLRGRPSLVCTSADWSATARVCRISTMLNFLASTLTDAMKWVGPVASWAPSTEYWLISHMTSRSLQSACSSMSTSGISGDETVARGKAQNQTLAGWITVEKRKPLTSKMMASGSGTEGGTKGVSNSSDSSAATATSFKTSVAGVRVKEEPMFSSLSPPPSSTRLQSSTTSATLPGKQNKCYISSISHK